MTRLHWLTTGLQGPLLAVGVVDQMIRGRDPSQRGAARRRAVVRPLICSLMFGLAGILGIGLGSPARAETPAAGAMAERRADESEFAQAFRPVLEVLSGQLASFELQATVQGPIEGSVQALSVRLAKWDDSAFDLELTHADYAVAIHRRPEAIFMALPKHRVVYAGRGELQGVDHLELVGLTDRLISRGSVVSTYAAMISGADTTSLGAALRTLLELTTGDQPGCWVGASGTELRLQSAAEGGTPAYVIQHGDWSATLRVATPNLADSSPWAGPQTGEQLAQAAWADWQHESLDRDELERTLSRGVRRALEVLLPSPALKNPRQNVAKTEHGELRWVDGQRLVLLQGTPEQVGRAHGQLLQTQSHACIDSVLHAFGTVQTVINGRWFRSDLEAAYERLRPHIPVDHLTETRALADSLGLPQDTMEVLNVFPELFHCSGFAVFGDATVDGKLYHGRVLDYMTMIGLQDAATTFVIAIDGKIPFATVGYAGFTGSVSGMNLQRVSLGEMGGRGEGQWDGVPMATLMRRALEECHTLAEVVALWRDNPRTCEYYYVFADGKDRSAVGVAATPEKVEFVYPGDGHPLLGEGIKDTVLLSAGDRLATLRGRVQQFYGRIDKSRAQWLMSRPVAMESNLHNVLFVPEDGLFQVANASHSGPAADQPYVEYDLNALVQELRAATQPVSSK